MILSCNCSRLEWTLALSSDVLCECERAMKIKKKKKKPNTR
jgi:hypothetical protein